MGQIKPKPDDVEIPDDETWESLTSFQRWYYKNREDKLERNKQHRRRRREWLKDYKSERGCSRCDEEHPACLDFHHTSDDKEHNVANMANDGYSKERIKEEIEKCVILCANCHRKETYQKT